MTECIFKCAMPPPDEELIAVEMNVGKDGKFHAKQTDEDHVRRVPGKAHQSCYAQWYERTYGVPFG